MSKLHLISKPLELKQLKMCLIRFATIDDPLLFIGDSVTTLLNKDVLIYLSQHSYKINLLSVDCKCRGLSQLMPDSIKQISDKEMVELTLNHQQIISW